MKVKSFILLSLIFILSSCKVKQINESSSQATGVFPSMSNTQERLLNAEEIKIGTRVCSSLKKKRLYFETLSNNAHSMNGIYSKKSCNQTVMGDEKLFKAVLINANPIEMEFITKDLNSDINFKNVITDQTSFLKVICDEIQANSLKISNTIRSNLVAYTFTFKEVNKGKYYDRVEILKRAPKQNSNEMRVQSGEVYELYTKTDQIETKFMGLEFYKERVVVCENQLNFSQYIEKFTKPLTSFDF